MHEKFSQFTYQRPDISQVRTAWQKLLEEFDRADSPQGQEDALRRINLLRQEFESMASLARIRHTMDTKDPFYQAEQDYFDETEPFFQELVHNYYRSLTASPFRRELAQTWGEQLFRIAEMTLKTFSPAVIEDLQQENKLASRYKRLLASASIPFDGQERNLEQMVPFQQDTDRRTRKAAYEARYAFFAQHREEFDQIYDQLVQLRTKIAGKLGFDDFVTLGYLRMNRADYDAKMVASFRRQVVESVVPLASRLREKQRQRLGLDNLLYYDEKVFYPHGNATPTGDPQEIMDAGQEMYTSLSAETGEFYREMTSRSLMDLTSRKGKAAGGYCDYLAKFRAPFIFANFNGTSGDIDVLTHEAGHAFQVWLCRDLNVPEYYFATMEAAEIPSMGMEFFAWPWMDNFFGAKADKYRYSHLSESLLFLSYGTLVDEFQHEIYTNPQFSPTERRQLWRRLEKKYLPHRDYAGQPFLEEGGFWFQQGHLFEVPFYYIDYVLAQVSVFQLWQRANDDRQAAWTDYLAFCRAGGSLPFTGLLEKANLVSPFEPGCVASVAAAVKAWIDDVDDRKL
ncbi:M3 family oligoendopeptidase [Dethiobacter alkaliphilus]|uniref:M3 family oligoendopeptidase n=1 Tax=Dethiobacter alkaliphilus TaxID=427926 RepID=UPI002227E890|nr:M3 family oligoendopeptidase [Dethiobacter alkaliphilus]MCW3488921.1 M3 family oligoendopeptidase [Dethiobacter alkaliphilus]